MNNPILSICIATFNRANYIGETLESIIAQITDEVEIVVVDGASTDNTSLIVNSYLKICKELRYIQLPSKGGVDQDYCKAVELAKGKMCWLFTDDDLIKPGAISAVLAEAEKEYSLIVINAEVKNKDFSKRILNRRLQFNENKVFARLEIEELFKCTIPHLSFIGGVIINRNLWLQREKEQYFDTEFIHVGVIFQAPLPGPALIIAKPYITIRLGNAQWTPHAFEIWIIKWPKLLCSFKYISEQSKKEYKPIPSLRRLRNVIVKRSERAYSLAEYKKWFSKENLPLWWKFILLLISRMPVPITKFIIFSYLSLNRQKSNY